MRRDVIRFLGEGICLEESEMGVLPLLLLTLPLLTSVLETPVWEIAWSFIRGFGHHWGEFPWEDGEEGSPISFTICLHVSLSYDQEQDARNPPSPESVIQFIMDFLLEESVPVDFNAQTVESS